MIEKAVLVSPQHGILRTTCEVEDTPDPEVKHFRFRAWPTEGFQSGMRDGLPDFLCDTSASIHTGASLT